MIAGTLLGHLKFPGRINLFSFRLFKNTSKMTAITQVSSNKMFGGFQKVYSHESTEFKCTMKFGVYIPPQAEVKICPVLYWLSGLTCTEQSFVSKAGAQRVAAEKGIILVAPDTSPRGVNIEGEDYSWDFGSGAGFYVDATEEKWKTNYRMYSYVTKELPEVINANFSSLPDKMSIFGHSMGGHGALICALKNPGKFQSVSAFAPISNPIKAPWGIKAFTGYLGGDQSKWKLPEVINANFSSLPDKMSTFGNSMGGHGALICALKSPGKFQSVSAFAPISNPIKAQWRIKAFTGYLGGDQSKWQEYDATELVKKYTGPALNMLVDQGKADNFYVEGQLLPDNLSAECASNSVPINLRIHEGYDHSYYFIATFIEEHINHHAKFLFQ